MKIKKDELETRTIRAYKYRVYPTAEQEAQLLEWIRQLHEIWNHYLAIGRRAREQEFPIMNWVGMCRDFTELNEAYSGAFTVPRSAVTMTQKDLFNSWLAAFRRKDEYFKKKAAGIEVTEEDAKFGFPKFRNHPDKSLYIKVSCLEHKHLYTAEGFFQFPKIKTPVRYNSTRPLPDNSPQKSYAGVMSFKGGKWYVVFQVEVKQETKKAPARTVRISTAKPHGFPLEDSKFEADYLAYRERVKSKYKNWQRKMSCRVGYETEEVEELREELNKTLPPKERVPAPRQSKNYRKASRQLGRLGAVGARIHLDYLHKLANYLTENYRHIRMDITDWDHLAFKKVINCEDDLHRQNCGQLVKLIEEKLELYPDSTFTVTYPPREQKDETTGKKTKKRIQKLLAGKKWKQISLALAEKRSSKITTKLMEKKC